MNRGTVLGILVVVGAAAVSVSAFQRGQEAGADGPKVILSVKVKDNLYLLTGPGGVPNEGRDSSGGNVAAFITGNGVVVVDAKNPGWGRPILEKIKTLTDKPITMVIDTHTHGDHTSGQVEFPASIDIVAQEKANIDMRKTAMPRDERMKIFEGDNAKFLPKRTFKDKMTIGAGADRIDLYYFGRGHTDGDAWVVFPALRAMHAADMFSGKNPPMIDENNDGSPGDFPQTLDKAIAGIKDVDTIITGHSSVMTWADLKEYAGFTKALLSATRSALKAGKSVDEVAAAYKVPQQYKGYYIRYPFKAYVQAVNNEMTKK